MNQKISEKYRNNRDSYASRFPAAHRFLMALESGVPDGLWLSTSTNAHLYKNNAFLSYIRFGNVQHAGPTLILSPKYHITIAEGASDQSSLLFPMPILQTLRKHNVDGSRWWAERPDEGFELRNATPDVVFDDLLDLLRAIEIPVRGVSGSASMGAALITESGRGTLPDAGVVLECRAMEYELSHHAADMLRRRGIRREWVEAALDSPQKVERDTVDAAIVHHLRTIEEYDGRVLRVLYNEAMVPVRIVSVFFDRRMKGKI